MTKSQPHWSFLQVNLGRGIKASQDLEGSFKTVPDIILIQEPYAPKGVVVGLPTSWNVFHTKGGGAAVAVTNRSLSTLIRYSSKLIVAVEISDLRHSVTVASIYFPPRGDIEDGIRELERVVNLRNQFLLLGGDLNARHPAWDRGCSGSDLRRGNALFEFLNRNSLVVHNTLDSPPTYTKLYNDGSLARSWIDLTVTDGALYSLLTDWEVIDSAGLTDHNFVRYKIGSSKLAEIQLGFSITTKTMKRIARDLAQDPSPFINAIRESKNPEDIDSVVDHLTVRIQELSQKYLRKNREITVPISG